MGKKSFSSFKSISAEPSVTAPSALPSSLPHELPNVSLFRKGFQYLFRLNIAIIIVSLLNNTFKLWERIPLLGLMLNVMSFAINILILVTLWKLGAAVSRFRKAVYCNLLPLAITPFITLLETPRILDGLAKSSTTSVVLVILILLLGLLFLCACLASYQQLTACAEALTSLDNTMAEKWHSLCPWQVVFFGIFGAGLVLVMLLNIRPLSFRYFFTEITQFLSLLILVPAIGAGITKVIELNYLNQSAKLFE